MRNKFIPIIISLVFGSIIILLCGIWIATTQTSPDRFIRAGKNIQPEGELIFLNENGEIEFKGDEPLPELQSEIGRFYEAVPVGIYRLINQNKETDLNPNHLVQMGPHYYRNTNTGDIYSLLATSKKCSKTTDAHLFLLDEIGMPHTEHFFVYKNAPTFAAQLAPSDRVVFRNRRIWSSSYNCPEFFSNERHQYEVESKSLEFFYSDSESFDLKHLAYWKDSQHVWLSQQGGSIYDRIIDGYDVETFGVLDSYATFDKNHLYIYDKPVEGADPESYQFLKFLRWEIYEKRFGTTLIFRDKNQVYADYCALKNIDPDTLSVTYKLPAHKDTSPFATSEFRDKNGIFRIIITEQISDPGDTTGFGRDRFHVLTCRIER